jgi:hypothetical protein
VGIEEFVFQVVEGVVIQLKLSLERPIGHTTPLAQQGHHLIQDCDKVHPISSLLSAESPRSCATPS